MKNPYRDKPFTPANEERVIAWDEGHAAGLTEPRYLITRHNLTAEQLAVFADWSREALIDTLLFERARADANRDRVNAALALVENWRAGDSHGGNPTVFECAEALAGALGLPQREVGRD